MELAYSLYLTDTIHTVSQVLLVPTIIILLLLVGYGIWCIGSIIVEVLTERRNFRVQMPTFLAALTKAKPDDIPQTIANSGLLNRQKAALLVLWDYRCLPPDSHLALAKRLLANEDMRYKRIAGRNDGATKIAPMFGLMGTLIPLGPGIVALGQGDTTTLSQSLGVAFDTTVSGLVVAAVCFVVSRIRRNWYENYMQALESAMTSLLEVTDQLRDAGQLDRDEPGTSAVDLGYIPKPYQMNGTQPVLSALDAEEDNAESNAQRTVDAANDADGEERGAGAADRVEDGSGADAPGPKGGGER